MYFKENLISSWHVFCLYVTWKELNITMKVFARPSQCQKSQRLACKSERQCRKRHFRRFLVARKVMLTDTTSYMLVKKRKFYWEHMLLQRPTASFDCSFSRFFQFNALLGDYLGCFPSSKFWKLTDNLMSETTGGSLDSKKKIEGKSINHPTSGRRTI
jgi:hypothetical protein